MGSNHKQTTTQALIFTLISPHHNP